MLPGPRTHLSTRVLLHTPLSCPHEFLFPSNPCLFLYTLVPCPRTHMCATPGNTQTIPASLILAIGPEDLGQLGGLEFLPGRSHLRAPAEQPPGAVLPAPAWPGGGGNYAAPGCPPPHAPFIPGHSRPRPRRSLPPPARSLPGVGGGPGVQPASPQEGRSERRGSEAAPPQSP
jgi:hypothetical protein